MKRAGLSRVLCVLLACAALCGWAGADVGARAPQFTARTLEGETFNNASLRGSVVLLQFWTTRCAECRRNRAAVERLARRFSGEGLVVLTVDEGETAARVRSYLKSHPAAGAVVLDRGRRLAARFGRHGVPYGVPYYVVIDRDGYIAGMGRGRGGEDALASLVSLAGLSRPEAPRPAVGQEMPGVNAVAAASPGVTPPKVIELPMAPRAERAKPSLKTIFVLADGKRLESDRYTIENGVVHVMVDGKQRTIALSQLDLKATVELNRQRGVELKVPQDGSEVFVAF